MAEIEVNGKKYKVTENLGYQAGHWAKMVETQDGEKVAVKECGEWRFWGIADKLQSGGRATGQ